MSFLACTISLLLSSPAEVKSIEAEGYKWEYVFAKPAGPAKGLIIAMHGAGGSGPQFNESAEWASKATKAGFAVVLPSGQPSRMNLEANFRTNPRLWNSGQLNARSPRTKINDLAFLDKLVNTCFKDIGEVPLFLSGHSNGAGMSFRVAYEWSDRIRAMGMMSGNLLSPLSGQSKKPIPTLWIVGEKDPLSPFEGGTTKLEMWGTEKENRPVMVAARDLLKWQRLDPVSFTQGKKGADIVTLESGSLTILKLLGHGHAWPGGKKGELPESIVGPNVSKLDATSEIIKFFESQLVK